VERPGAPSDEPVLYVTLASPVVLTGLLILLHHYERRMLDAEEGKPHRRMRRIAVGRRPRLSADRNGDHPS
jgi:hypothetical protein